MRVEVVTPEDYMGDVIGDLNSRRGSISGMDQRGNARVITAQVPLATMFGYVNNLRSMTQGRAQLHHAFRPLRPGAAERRGRSPREAWPEAAGPNGETRRRVMAKAKFERTKPH